MLCDDIGDDWVLGDKDALKQIFLILLDNASKHTLLDSTITLRSKSCSNKVTVQVSDDGPGISEGHLSHIFDRFYRGDEVRTGNSAGLGLAIAKELVAGHNASISVKSQVNRW